MWNKSITYLDVEPTSICNAACPMCARNVNGEGLNPYLTLKSLTANWFRKNITPDQIKQLNKMFLLFEARETVLLSGFFCCCCCGCV